ncbi:hypothetical protein [Thiofilum flexile]|uniref:hypothetical protein n=1 Tax=Thiofilum flexile TaxID=125627 RepID=UPI0003667BCA|nr:hypothetical protein [Thiofilum flexile]
MHSGREKWPLVALAVAILSGVGGLAAIGGGLLFGKEKAPELLLSQYYMAATTSSVPATPTNTSTSVSTENTTTVATSAATAPAATTSTPDPAPTAVAPSPAVAVVSNEEIAKETQTNADKLLSEVSPEPVKVNYENARWDPIHFKPAIEKASNAECLKCHQEVLTSKVRDSSPAGLNKKDTLAWYQTLDTYQGEQMTFHQRHLTAPFINKVATMQCITCHQGNDPREETGTGSVDVQSDLTLRKMVNPQVCLMCHGQFPHEVMGLPGPWSQSGAAFQNNCLLCHAAIRTNRHQVNFLKAHEIEKEGMASSDSCYGCHGGRAWYRISFPYPRHPWPGSGAVPDWAKDRPTESDYRFVIQGTTPAPATATKP